MTDLVIEDGDLGLLEDRPEISLEETDAMVEVNAETDGDVSVLPWLVIESGVLPEAFQMSMACIVPYFFESILREADIDFSYTEIDGSVFEPDRDYSSAVQFYLQRKDLPGLLTKIRTTGAFDIYDIIIQLPEERDIVLQHDDRLGLVGFDDAAVDEMVERWEDRLDEELG
jgi:hypothetical protein